MVRFNNEPQNEKFTDYCNYLKIKGITFSKIYKQLGITNQQFIRIKKGDSRAKSQYLKIIEKDFSALIDGFNNKSNDAATSNYKKIIAIPLYNVDVMNKMDFDMLSSDKIKSNENINIPNFNDGRSAVTVFGDAGAPRYNGGDIIILAEKINVDDEIEFGRFYIIITKTSRYIKKIMPCDKMQCLTLVSENIIYPPMNVLKKNVKGLLKILGKIQREGF